MGDLVQLVEYTDDPAHWSVEQALETASEAIASDGAGRALLVSYVDSGGTVRVWCAGHADAVTVLAMRVAQHEVEGHTFRGPDDV